MPTGDPTLQVALCARISTAAHHRERETQNRQQTQAIAFQPPATSHRGARTEGSGTWSCTGAATTTRAVTRALVPGHPR